MEDVELVDVGVGSEDIEELRDTVCDFVEYVDLLAVDIKGATAVEMVYIGVWVEDNVLLFISGIVLVEDIASADAVDMTLLVMVAVASADEKLDDVCVVVVVAGELADVNFVTTTEAVFVNAEFVEGAEYAEIVDVSDMLVSFVALFDKDCGVVEYMELMDVGVVDAEDKEIVDVGIVVVTIEEDSDKGCGVVEYMELMDEGVVKTKDVDVAILDDVGFIE